MSSTQGTASRFDRISEVYDETRDPLSEEAIDKAASVLTRDGCRRILEVGLGTGRIAMPFMRRGFEITGIDVSSGMLAKAREKGLQNLLMADANLPPLRPKALDVVMMAHVVHLLDDPVKTFKTLSGIATKEMVVFTRKRENPQSPSEDYRGPLGEALRRILGEMGYELPQAGNWRRRFAREVEFLSQLPPTELITLEDVSGATTIGERLSLIEKRAFGWPEGVPEAVLHRAIERVRSSVEVSREISFRRVEQMAIWKLVEPGVIGT